MIQLPQFAGWATKTWSVIRAVVEQIFISFSKSKTLKLNVERYRSGHNGPDSKSGEIKRRLVEVIEANFSEFSFGRL